MKENKMGTMPMLPLIFNMALPVMASMLVLALYNVVDSIFVAMVSENALTAVSLAFPLQNLMIAVGAGTGTGINALVSRYLGQQDPKQAKNVALNGFFLALLSYLAFLALAVFGMETFFRSQTDVAEIVDLGTQYGSIVCGLSFGCFFSITMERILQATGRTMLAMYVQGIGAVVNLVLDPILIFGLLGAPKLGVAGAALATVAGQIAGAILALYLCRKHNPEVPISFTGFRPSGKVIGSIYQIAVPSIVMQAIGSVMLYCLNLILMGFSTTASAVLGAYFKLQSFVFMPVFGLSNALVSVVAFNYGAKLKERVMQAFKFGWFIAVGILGAGFLVFELAPHVLLGMFNPTTSMLNIGMVAFRIIALSFIPASFCLICSSMFQGLGCAMYSLYVSAARQLVVLVPVAYLLSLQGSLDLVWWAFPIADLCAVVVSGLCLRRTLGRVVSSIGD